MSCRSVRGMDAAPAASRDGLAAVRQAMHHANTAHHQYVNRAHRHHSHSARHASRKHGRRRVASATIALPLDEPSRMSDAERKAKIAVKVVPRASRDEVVGWLGDRLKIKIAAPPQDGRANDALEAFLAERLGLP